MHHLPFLVLSAGKPAFPCTAEALAERWRTGRAHCGFEGAAPGGGAPAAKVQTAEESLGQAD
jgi:hypothetical protein